MKHLTLILIGMILFLVSCKRTPPGLHVTASEYGDDWPFTVEEGYVNCESGTCVIFYANGKKYAINGTAQSRAKTRGYHNVDEIWKDDPTYEGLKVNIGTMISKGLEQCK